MQRVILDKLKKWSKQQDRKPLIVKGARQVGKTYSLQEFGRNAFKRCHYLNFEEDEELKTVFEKDLKPKRIIQELCFVLDCEIDCKFDLLIFDEIQQCPRALTSLKYFCEEMPDLAICAAGSLIGIHLNDVSFPVGKVTFLNMYPMSFEEFLCALGDTKSFNYVNSLNRDSDIPEVIHSHLWKQLKAYFIVGGMPEVVKVYAKNMDNMFVAFQHVRKKQEDLLLTYLADIAKHSGKQNSMHIERLLYNIPTQLAKEQDGSAPKFRFKGVIPGVSGYSRMVGSIDWLEKAGLLIKVPIVNRGQLPLSAYASENVFKLYMFDVGLLGTIGKLSPKAILDYGYGSYKGYFAENFVAQEFLCNQQYDLFSWREKTAEVEFLHEVDGNIIPVEIKSGWVTQAKSIKVFAERYKSPYRVVMSAKPLTVSDAIHNYPLYTASKFPLS